MRGEKPKIARVSIYSDDQLKAAVAINDGGDLQTDDRTGPPRKRAKRTTRRPANRQE